MRLDYQTADEAAAAYFAAVDDAAAIPAQRLSMTVEVCGRPVGSVRRSNGARALVICEGPRTTRGGRVHEVEDEWLGPRRVVEDVSICARCGQVWEPAERELGLIRGEVRIRGRIGYAQGGGVLVRAPRAARAGVAEARISELADRLVYLHWAVERRPRDLSRAEWAEDLLLWRVVLRAGSFREAARIAQEARSAPEPTEHQVERRITRSRGIVDRRLKRRGEAMRPWKPREVAAEIRRLEARRAKAPRLDRLAFDRTIERLRLRLGRSNGSALA